MCVQLAVEDEISEAVVRKLLSEYYINDIPALGKRGNGYLRSNMESWRQMAKHNLMIILTDLDTKESSQKLKDDWLKDGRLDHPNLLLLVAVREIESWLLADHEALEKLLQRQHRFPEEPDGLCDPKQTLLNLAERSPREIKKKLVPQRGSVASQGIEYNNTLTRWVEESWSADRAVERSPSLLEARRAIHDLFNQERSKNKRDYI